MDTHTTRGRILIDDAEALLTTDLIGYLHAVEDSHLEELLARLRAWANELQEQRRSVPRNRAVLAELAWILIVNNEVRRRRVLFETLERELAS